VQSHLRATKQYSSWYKLLLYVALFATLVAIAMSGFAEEIDAIIFWGVVYAFSFLYIINRSTSEFYSPSVILLLAYLLLLGVGSVLYSYIRGVNYWAYSTNLIGIGFLSLWLGTVFPILKFHPSPTTAKFYGFGKLKSVVPFYGMTLTAFILSFLLFASADIPLFSTNVNEAKLDLFSGKGYLAIFFRGLPVISLAFYYGAFSRNSQQAKKISHVLAFIVLSLMFVTGYRALTLIFLASYVSLICHLNQWKLKLPQILLGVSAVLAFLGTMGAYRRGNMSIDGALGELAVILTARPAITDNIMVHYAENNFYYGSRYFEDLKKLLPGSQTGANVDLKNELFGNAEKMAELAGITPGICAESYMNFGAWWIPVSLFIIGFAMRLMFHAIKTKPTPAMTIAYFLLIFNMAGAIQSGFGTKLIHLLYLLFWILVIRFFFTWKLKWS
jgi:hypothetical protein